MEINRYLGIVENVLKSGEEKETKAKWYYGKLKLKDKELTDGDIYGLTDGDTYGFLFHVVVNGKNYGCIIPMVTNYLYDADTFDDAVKFAVRKFKRSYKLTMENNQ